MISKRERAMKSSSSSSPCSTLQALILLSLLLLGSSSSASWALETSHDEAFWVHVCRGHRFLHHHHYHHRRRRGHQPPPPPSWCLHLPYATPRPPPADGEMIDPRYGVAKRLVPTGPNPLHN